MARPWWEERPGTYAQELDALLTTGFAYTEDAGAKERGILRLLIECPLESLGLDPELRATIPDPIRLVATFPDTYPFFRPEVQATNIELPRHQHPFGGNLCLIGRRSINWEADQTLASFLIERLPLVLVRGRVTDPSDLSEFEDEQAEPYSDYYCYAVPGFVAVGSDIVLPAGITAGYLEVGISKFSSDLQMAVLSVRGGDGEPFWNTSSEVSQYFSAKTLQVAWQLVSAPIREPVPGKVTSEHVHGSRHLKTGLERWHKGPNGGDLSLIAFAYPEESAPGQTRNGWLFLLQRRASSKAQARACFLRASRFDEGYFHSRATDLKPLRERSALLVGLGCVGAPIAFELARAGIKRLLVLDRDIIEPVNTMRWPLGLLSAGQSKVNTVVEFIRENYPFTEAVGYNCSIGSPRDEGISELELFDEVLSDVDIVIDASAEFGIHHVVSELCRAKKVTYLGCYGTHGGWGGEIVRIVPDMTAGCWACFQHAILDGTIPSAPASNLPFIQPFGCADPTFTGPSFDLTQVSLEATRLAVSTLAGCDNGGYPKASWDVEVLSLRQPDGMLKPATWQAYKLERHSDCQGNH